jgi:hypothetical protein
MKYVQREDTDQGWVSSNWFRYHLAIVPIGTVGVTTLLLFLTGDGWHWWSQPRDLVRAGQVAPFGAVVYGTAMFLVENLLRKVWEIRNNDIKKARKEGFQEGRDAGRNELSELLGQERVGTHPQNT